MITGKDFIITGLQPWDLPIGSNARDIAKEIAKHNRVLYINTPLDTITLWKSDNAIDVLHRKEVIYKKRETIRHIEENLWIMDYPLVYGPVTFCQMAKYLTLSIE